ncbi:MAG: hypothetical protein GX763_09800, partial [Clostridiaceae bacterium]|nr:hypothetical protein [Clostridiaceae bacterium]
MNKHAEKAEDNKTEASVVDRALSDKAAGVSGAGKLGNWILRLIKGALIGIGAIMPGLSG